MRSGPTTKPKLYGCETPRLFTPPLRELTPETTAGYSVIEFAEDILGVELFPWQKWLLIHALELLEDGSFRFKYVIVLVARQNGKSTLSKVLALWWLYVCGAPLVLGTAQDLDTAEEVWDGALEWIQETPELAELADTPILRNGKKTIRLLRTPLLPNNGGQRYKVKAASRRAGRGLTGHKIILDELREHLTWNAWGAITKTTMAIADAQIWGYSNAGDITSVVLKYLRMKAHEALGDPDGIVAASKIFEPTIDSIDEELLTDLADDDDELEDSDLEVDASDLFLAEWSATPGCSISDRSEWAQANPSMGWIAAMERNIRSSCKTDPEWVFRTEVLCQWPEGGLDGPFKPGTWEETLNKPKATPAGLTLAREDWITSKDLVASVAVAADRSRAHIAIGGRRDDGVGQAEIQASRHGVEWVRGWLMARKDRIRAVTGQTRGEQVSGLMEQLAEDNQFTIPVVPWQGGDVITAHGEAYDQVRDGRIRHNPQPLLDLPAASAVKKALAGGWVISLPASPGDAAPLQAWIGAVWLLGRPVPEPRTPASPQAVKNTDAQEPARRATTASSGRNIATVRF